MKEKENDDDDDNYFEIHTMKFYLFNEKIREFEL
jgi:hypothetical protein